jgi:hypothetical protein
VVDELRRRLFDPFESNRVAAFLEQTALALKSDRLRQKPVRILDRRAITPQPNATLRAVSQLRQLRPPEKRKDAVSDLIDLDRALDYLGSQAVSAVDRVIGSRRVGSGRSQTYQPLTLPDVTAILGTQGRQ